MKKPNKRRPDRTHYQNGGISRFGPNKGRRRFIQIRGKWRTLYTWGCPRGIAEAPAPLDYLRGSS